MKKVRTREQTSPSAACGVMCAGVVLKMVPPVPTMHSSKEGERARRGQEFLQCSSAIDPRGGLVNVCEAASPRRLRASIEFATPRPLHCVA